MSATGRGLSGAMLLALSYAPVGWGSGSVFRGGCKPFVWRALDFPRSALTLEGFEGLRECFFECQPGLARGENRKDDDAVVGHEKSD